MQHENAKQIYTTPELTVYGNVEAITAGPNRNRSDAMAGSTGGFAPGGGPIGGGSGS